MYLNPLPLEFVQVLSLLYVSLPIGRRRSPKQKTITHSLCCHFSSLQTTPLPSSYSRSSLCCLPAYLLWCQHQHRWWSEVVAVLLFGPCSSYYFRLQFGLVPEQAYPWGHSGPKHHTWALQIKYNWSESGRSEEWKRGERTAKRRKERSGERVGVCFANLTMHQSS